MAFPDLLAAADEDALSILGDPVRYETSSGEAIELTGIFDAAYVRASAGEAGVSSCTPAVFVRLEHLVAPVAGRVDPAQDEDPTVTIGGVGYSVEEVKKDGQGGVVLVLNRR